MTFPATATSVRGGSRTDLTWMVTAGVTVPLNERLGLAPTSARIRSHGLRVSLRYSF